MASVNKVTLRQLYIVDGKSIPDIAALLGMPRSTVRVTLIRVGVPLRSRADGVRLARPKLGKHLLGKTRVFTSEWRANIRAAAIARGERTAMGVSLKPNGYMEVTRGPNKGRGLHRVIVERRVGRKLGRNEVVHHDDEQKANNADSNLILMARSAHTSLHRRKLKGEHSAKR